MFSGWFGGMSPFLKRIVGFLVVGYLIIMFIYPKIPSPYKPLADVLLVLIFIYLVCKKRDR